MHFFKKKSWNNLFEKSWNESIDRLSWNKVYFMIINGRVSLSEKCMAFLTEAGISIAMNQLGS